MRRFEVGPREVTLAPQEKPTLVGRLVRRFVVWLAAWAYRRGVTGMDLDMALSAAFPRRSRAWRQSVKDDALARNGITRVT